MRLVIFLATILVLSACDSLTVAADKATEPAAKFNPRLTSYLAARSGEFDQIPAERKQDLQRVADYVRKQSDAGEPAKLVFICTHNSRRSHMAQIWATDAANYFGLSGVQCFSGGTEGTAFNPRAVAALERAGIEIKKPAGDDKNPKYQVQVADGVEPLHSFSKKYSDPPNPTEKYCAVMTCSNADKACPTVAGSSLRVAITYDDPKMADDTPQESATYDARCAQICREMLYLFSKVGK
jgi:protein-tyrosine-phosphatase